LSLKLSIASVLSRSIANKLPEWQSTTKARYAHTRVHGPCSRAVVSSPRPENTGVQNDARVQLHGRWTRV